MTTPRSWQTIATTLLLLVPQLAAADVQNDLALCGPKTSAQANEPEKLARIQTDMPPVLDQNPTSWCYAFSATDMLNYFIHKTSGTPYDARHLISPIDAVAAQRYYEDQHHDGALATQVGHVDVGSGGTSIDVFMGVQELPGMRSQVQMPFYSSDSRDPAVRQIISSVKSQEMSEEQYGGDPRTVSKEFKTFRIINPSLFSAAKTKQWTDDHGETLDHYHELAQALAGQADIKVPPFTAESFTSENPGKFLAKIRDTLALGRPVNVSVSAEGIFPELLKDGQGLGGHAMTVVGSGYLAGRCVARLRNSWGTESRHGSGGYIDVPVDQLVASVSSKEVQVDKTTRYTAEWISPADPSLPPALAGKFQHIVGSPADGEDFIGRVIKRTENGNRYVFNYFEGILSTDDGAIKFYDGGSLKKVDRLPVGGGALYSGDVKEIRTSPTAYRIAFETGISRSPAGAVIHFKDGQAVAVENEDAGDGKRYTGTVQEQSGGHSLHFIKGVLRFPDGTQRNYP